MSHHDRGPSRRGERAARRYARLLRLYPAAHQQAFGAQMLRTFRDHYQEAVETEGEAKAHGSGCMCGGRGQERGARAPRGSRRKDLADADARTVLEPPLECGGAQTRRLALVTQLCLIAAVLLVWTPPLLERGLLLTAQHGLLHARAGRVTYAINARCSGRPPRSSPPTCKPPPTSRTTTCRPTASVRRGWRSAPCPWRWRPPPPPRRFCSTASRRRAWPPTCAWSRDGCPCRRRACWRWWSPRLRRISSTSPSAPPSRFTALAGGRAAGACGRYRADGRHRVPDAIGQRSTPSTRTGVVLGAVPPARLRPHQRRSHWHLCLRLGAARIGGASVRLGPPRRARVPRSGRRGGSGRRTTRGSMPTTSAPSSRTPRRTPARALTGCSTWRRWRSTRASRRGTPPPGSGRGTRRCGPSVQSMLALWLLATLVAGLLVAVLSSVAGQVAERQRPLIAALRAQVSAGVGAGASSPARWCCRRWCRSGSRSWSESCLRSCWLVGWLRRSYPVPHGPWSTRWSAVRSTPASDWRWDRRRAAVGGRALVMLHAMRRATTLEPARGPRTARG